MTEPVALEQGNGRPGKVDISIVVPAYNEERRIQGFLKNLVDSISASKSSWEILVVADGCRDKTVEVVGKYQTVVPTLRLITFSERLGKGGALRLGFSNSRGKVLLYMDADGGYDPKEIPNLLGALEKADCAIGFRLAAEATGTVPWSRMVAGYLFARLVKLLLLDDIRDTQAGFKAFKREVIEKIAPQVSAKGFDIDVQLLVRAKRSGFKLAEVPITYRFVEGSKVNVLRDGALMGLRVLGFWLHTLLERAGLLKPPNSREERHRRS